METRWRHPMWQVEGGLDCPCPLVVTRTHICKYDRRPLRSSAVCALPQAAELDRRSAGPLSAVSASLLSDGHSCVGTPLRLSQTIRILRSAGETPEIRPA